MKILVLNSGSSSLKYQLIDMTNEEVIAKGLCERIGIKDSVLTYDNRREKIVINKDMKNHEVAIQMVLDMLMDKDKGVIRNINEIGAVGHRVVHGGEKFSKSVVIDNNVLSAINDCIDLAPLHNPANITGIRACKALMPNTPMVAVFDTAFHQTMDKSTYLYAIPYELYEKYSIRKYGFHGTSHKYVASRASAMLGKDIKDLRIITCHLGNGASVCAVKNGKSIDTSMGFTPLAGLVMGTRCGDIDAAIIKFLMEKENFSIDEIDTLINKKSGIFGVSGVSSDFRDVEKKASQHDERSNVALDMFALSVRKFIGQYIVEMGGVDALVFTAGCGENDAAMRKLITRDLSFLGISIDDDKNNVRGQEIDISSSTAKVHTLVIPTNEELAIARETETLVLKR
ncbi:MAG: acetate kinase [Clostridiales bacterium]|nr:acetate kinase [Clostridiales bacterium]